MVNEVDIGGEWSIGIYASSSSDPLNFSGENIWYIFTATTRNDILSLYYAKELTGP